MILKTRRCFYLLLASVLFPVLLSAQTFKKIGVRDGLPSSIIYDIEPDDNGVIWIASFGSGICRYDGRTFKVLNEDIGLPSDLVRCLALNKDRNKMYVGAQGALSIITPDSIFNKNRLFHDSLTPNVLFIAVSQNTVQTSSNFGLITLVNDSVVRTVKQLQMITSYYRAPDGKEYVGSRQGLFMIREDGSLINLSTEFHTDFGAVTDLKAFRGQLLVSTSRGIFVIDRLSHLRHITKANGLPEENVRCMVVDKKQVLWLGTSNGLVSTRDLVSFRKYDEKNGIDETEIKCLAVDKDNILWVGTTSNGLFKLLASDILKFDVPNPVNAIAMDKHKTIFALTNKAAVYRLNNDSGRFVPAFKVHGLPDGAARHLSIDAFGNFYLTIYNKGFVKIDPDGKETWLTVKSKEQDNIALYSMASGDKVYLAFKRTVVLYDPATNRMDTLQRRLPGTYFQNLATDAKGRLWVAGGSGVICYTENNIRLINHDSHREFPPLVTNFVCPDKYGNAWAATDKGLVCVEGEQVYANYRKTGFASNELFGLQIIDTLLFTSCSKGLIQLNMLPAKNSGNRFVLVNEKFGLTQSDLTNKPLFSDSNYIWIGAANAVFRYKPVNYAGFGRGSRLFINDIVKDSASLVFRNRHNYLQEFVPATVPVQLRYKENDFTISFVSVNHRRLKEEFFTYRLLGLNGDWSVPSADTKVSYTNLNPGTYTFEVMQVGNPAGKASITIHIATPFYRSVWFLVLIIAVSLLLIYGFFRMRLRAVKKQNLLLEARVEQRTKQLQNKTVQLSQSNEELSKKNRLIIESIEYAKKIQDSILPSQPYLNRQFGTVQTAFFYAPKDIVSGDFFYTYKNGPINYFAVVDCAGHGVPGALLSFSVNSILHGIIENITSFKGPSAIIRELLEKFAETYMKGKELRESFAISLLIFHAQEQNAYIASISQSVCLASGGSLQEIKACCSFLAQASETMSDTVVPVIPGDRFFLYSDGYYDQKGADGKKMFKGRMMREIGTSLNLPLSQQIDFLGRFFAEFKDSREQIDDATLFGVEI